MEHKHGNRILRWSLGLLCLVLLAALVWTIPMSANALESGAYVYTLNKDNKAIITGYNGNSAVVNIPATLDGYTVVGINNEVFRGHHEITSLTMPDTITDVGTGAFYGCGGLKSVTLAKGLTKMGAYAFYDCDGLTSIELPKNLVSTTDAYYYDIIYGYVYGPFIGCDNLKTVTFEEGATTIANGLFARMPALETIVLPDTITLIKSNAFEECPNLKNVTFSASLTKIEANAFKECTKLIQIRLPATLTEIGSGAFFHCADLNTVELSKGLTKMGAYAFYDCDGLTSIEIPKNLNTTYDAYYSWVIYGYVHGPFIGCDNLKTVTFEEGATTIANGLFARMPALETIVLPDTITLIKSNAFEECPNLKNVTFSASLTKIEANAFKECTKLIQIRLPATLTEIGSGAFFHCADLNTVELSKGLTKMGAYAFYDCDSLTSIEIPKNLNTTYDAYYSWVIYGYVHGPFIGCDNLKTVTFEEGTTTIANGLFARCPGIEQITIPDTVTHIQHRAFEETVSLKNIVIPDTVTTVGDTTFTGCTSLETVKWTSGVDVLPHSVFRNCTALNTIDIPDNLKRINNNAFENCDALAEIQLSANLSFIGDKAFYDCDALAEIIVPCGVTSIGAEVFRDCDALVKAELANSVTSLNNDIFRHCDILSEVTLSSGLTTIPARAFMECPQLEQIVIPRNVTTISDSAFNSSAKLSKVVTYSKLTSIHSAAFSYPNTTVFYGIKDSYTQQWAQENGYRFQENTVTATQITLNPTALSMKKGEKATLDLQILPLDAADEVIFQSSKPAVVTVDEFGKLTAVGTGSAVIKVYAGSQSASCKVTVTQAITGLQLNKSSLSLDVPQTYQLTATINPSDATDQTLTWTTSNVAVATVDANGLITAVNNGTAIITAEANDGSGKTASCTVKVTDPNNIGVSSIKLSSSNLTLNALSFAQLTATVSPSNAANRNLVWTSSDETVAVVNAQGVITAVNKGTAVITATAADGFGAEASCTVTVNGNGVLAQTPDQLESSHPYAANNTDAWLYIHDGAGALNITFDARTMLEEDFDFLLIYNGKGELVGEYTGDQLAGKTVRVPGNAVKLQLSTNAYDHQWGFKVTSILPEACSHSYSDGVCVNCGTVQPMGVTVAGSVTTGADGDTTVELLQNGKQIAFAKVSGKEGTYSIESVAAGTYTLKISKTNHVTREYEITVGTEAVTQDVKIHLIGDIDGNGKINVGDVSKLNSHLKGTNKLTDAYQLLCANVNGGSLNMGDTAALYGHIKGTRKLY